MLSSFLKPFKKQFGIEGQMKMCTASHEKELLPRSCKPGPASCASRLENRQHLPIPSTAGCSQGCASFLASQHRVGMERAPGWMHRNQPDPLQEPAAWKKCVNNCILFSWAVPNRGKPVSLWTYTMIMLQENLKLENTPISKHRFGNNHFNDTFISKFRFLKNSWLSRTQ